MAELNKYQFNVYSQNGEDGVIQEICNRLGLTCGYFVEFGAWDGIHLSNTYNLLKNGWSGTYIEGNSSKFKLLEKNMSSFQGKITLINTYVQTEGYDSLDNLLAHAGNPPTLDLLSIDIDSYDWHIWANFHTYRPSVVIIEINSSIAPGILQTHRDRIAQGSSFSSTIELAREKNYTAVCHTGNLILVKNESVHKLNLPAIDIRHPETLFNYKWVNK